MYNRMKSVARSIITGVPVLERAVRNYQYRTERALINGSHHTSNTHPSILHFSFNKAATQYVKSILMRAATKTGMTPVSLHEYAGGSHFPFLDHLSREEMENYQHVFQSRGYLYSVFGGMIEGIEKLDDYKIVLVTRDPRDILVSGFYSKAFSHPVPSQLGDKRERFLNSRQAAQNSSIDEYVMMESDRVFKIFHRYQTLLLDVQEHVHLTQYEEMISKFEEWVTALLSYCELETGGEFVRQLVNENAAMKPKKEDASQHLRKGVAGDYRNKLQPDTVVALNEKFAPILMRFGYE